MEQVGRGSSPAPPFQPGRHPPGEGGATLDVAEMRRELRSGAGGLPVLLWLLALLGMLWANVPWSDRYAGLEGFHKLLVIPLLLAQFRRSERGIYVVYGFLASCTAMLLASCGLMVLWKCCSVYVPGKISGYWSRITSRRARSFWSASLACSGSRRSAGRKATGDSPAARCCSPCLFLANIFYVAPGRTAIVIMPALLVIFGFYYFGWKGVAAAAVAGVVIAAAAWAASPLLRARVLASFSEVRAYGRQRCLLVSDPA